MAIITEPEEFHDHSRSRYRRHRTRRLAVEELVARGRLPRQTGVVITHGRRVRAVEIFGAPNLLRAYWSGIVRAYLDDPPETSNPPSVERALWAIRRMARMELKSTPGLVHQSSLFAA